MLLNNLKDLLMFFDNANHDKVQNANQIYVQRPYVTNQLTSYNLWDAIDELPSKCNNMRSIGLPCDLQKITVKKLSRASPHI